jgi:hypothetical protein
MLLMYRNCRRTLQSLIFQKRKGLKSNLKSAVPDESSSSLSPINGFVYNHSHLVLLLLLFRLIVT